MREIQAPARSAGGMRQMREARRPGRRHALQIVRIAYALFVKRFPRLREKRGSH